MVQHDPSRVNIEIGGNVDGNSVIGDNNPGTIVYNQAAGMCRKGS
jgi:hypothetical protein